MEFQGVEGKKYWKILGDRESFDEIPGGTVSGHSQQGAWTISGIKSIIEVFFCTL